MNWLEQEIAHLQRRIDKIGQNPDPDRPRSNALLYEAQRDLHVEQLKAWQTGSPPIVATIASMEPLMRSMGLIVFDYEHAADRQMIADEYADASAAEGFPEKACDRTIVEMGMVASGALPPPAFAVVTNLGCDPMYFSGLSMAQRANAPHYVLDIPLEENEENLTYVTAQLRELIDALVRSLPCHRPDEEQLRYLQDVNRQALGYMHAGYKVRKHRPSPMAAMDAFRLPPLPAGFPDPGKVLTYHRELVEELAAKANGPSDKDERLRVMWTCSGPYFAKPFDVLERKGARIVVFQIDVVARMYARFDPAYGDEQYGRRLTPLEEEARMAFCCSWAGKGARWVKAVVDVAKDLEIEAIVNFVQVGCMATVGLGKLVADAAETEGIPVLNIEGRQMIARDYNKASFESQLDQFIDLAIARKNPRVAVR